VKARAATSLSFFIHTHSHIFTPWCATKELYHRGTFTLKKDSRPTNAYLRTQILLHFKFKQSKFALSESGNITLFSYLALCSRAALAFLNHRSLVEGDSGGTRFIERGFTFILRRFIEEGLSL
jgi:hypothetical protein